MKCAQRGLPAGENSYVLQQGPQRLCVKDAFGQSVEDWKAILGQGVSVRTAEGMKRSRAEHAQAYRVTQPLPPAAEEAELLVLAGNGKGVIMRRPLAEEMREAGEATPGDGCRVAAAAASLSHSTSCQPTGERPTKEAA